MSLHSRSMPLHESATHPCTARPLCVCRYCNARHPPSHVSPQLALVIAASASYTLCHRQTPSPRSGSRSCLLTRPSSRDALLFTLKSSASEKLKTVPDASCLASPYRHGPSLSPLRPSAHAWSSQNSTLLHMDNIQCMLCMVTIVIILSSPRDQTKSKKSYRWLAIERALHNSKLATADHLAALLV